MIRPLLSGQALLDAILGLDPGAGGFALWWLGQSGFLLKGKGDYLLIDPYLSDSLTRKYAGTDKPHLRLTERCIDPACLGFVTTVACTHGHTDHFDPETLLGIASAPQRSAPLTLVLPASLLERGRQVFDATTTRLVPMDAGEEIEIGSFRLRAVPAAHVTIEHDAAGRHRFLGYIVTVGKWSVYHSGDTVWHDDVLAAALAARPNVALLPINGHDPRRGVAGNLDARGAAQFAQCLGVDTAIPHHFEMFAFNTADPADFAAACRECSVPHRVLRCGECWCPTAN